MKRLLPAIVLSGILACEAQAADVSTRTDISDSVTLSGSLGYLTGVAHEKVYKPNGALLSELVWDMQDALVLNGGMTFQATDRLSFYGNASLGLAANNYMDDYDWLGNPRPSEPNLHSWHDDTELDHYYTADVGAAFAMFENGANRFSVLGGFKYTDIQWSAYGGCYNYKYFHVRGCIDDDVKGITYRQTLPALYGGLGYAGAYDRWSLSLEGRLGMTLAGAEADDDHWLRDLNFIDNLNSAPYLALNGKVGYAVSDNADVVGSVAFDKFFEMRGETTYTETDTGYSERSNYDAGGDDLYTLNIALGLDYRF